MKFPLNNCRFVNKTLDLLLKWCLHYPQCNSATEWHHCRQFIGLHSYFSHITPYKTPHRVSRTLGFIFVTTMFPSSRSFGLDPTKLQHQHTIKPELICSEGSIVDPPSFSNPTQDTDSRAETNPSWGRSKYSFISGSKSLRLIKDEFCCLMWTNTNSARPSVTMTSLVEVFTLVIYSFQSHAVLMLFSQSL